MDPAPVNLHLKWPEMASLLEDVNLQKLVLGALNKFKSKSQSYIYIHIYVNIQIQTYRNTEHQNQSKSNMHLYSCDVSSDLKKRA